MLSVIAIGTAVGSAALCAAPGLLAHRAPSYPLHCHPRMGADADAERWLVDNVGPVGKKSRQGGSGWASFTRFSAGGREFFVKTSSRPCDQMFSGEAHGLRAMFATKTVVVPEVLHCADAESSGSYIIMEHLELGGRAEPRLFGRKMAEMHLATPADPRAAAGEFGFGVPNTIGGTPQQNAWADDWVAFFREQRIGFQLRTAADDALNREWKRVLAATHDLADLFVGVDIKPSVLHGDLWSGNIASVGGQPAIYDPATYYGHHEAEWGMSWCASFPPAFWQGYRELIPKDPGFAERAVLYELYHKLNHYNLFGGGYYSDSLGLMSQLAK